MAKKTTKNATVNTAAAEVKAPVQEAPAKEAGNRTGNNKRSKAEIARFNAIYKRTLAKYPDNQKQAYMVAKGICERIENGGSTK